MKLDVQVQGRKVASLFRERDDYVLQYERDAQAGDFVSLAMPVREEA
jgi:serine/threonine-protein kinase HipA